MEGVGRPHRIILTCEITWRVRIGQKSLLAQWADREHSGENQGWLWHRLHWKKRLKLSLTKRKLDDSQCATGST